MKVRTNMKTNKVIIGCDSHAPERVAKKEELLCATTFLSSIGITPIDEVELKPIR